MPDAGQVAGAANAVARIEGDDAPNELFGGPGNDIFFGGGGSDTISGGAGIDVAVYTGAQSEYLISPGTTVTIVDSTPGRDGVDTLLADVERLQFSDGVLAFDVSGDAGEGYRIYQAAFNRTPDQGGLTFWVHALDQGASLHDIAQGFVDSAEFKAVYGAAPTHAQIIDRFYQNVLGRDGERAGVDFWVGALDHGATVADVLAGFSESAENVSRVGPAIASGIALDLTIPL